MKFNNIRVYNFEIALHGMRNPMESYDKSDSHFESIGDYLKHESEDPVRKYVIGLNDMILAQKLIKAGTEHRKFMRQIFVSVDISAPLYWWKEFDTYKVGTVANSTSTMHKVAKKPITIDCFETDDYEPDLKVMDSDEYNEVDLTIDSLMNRDELCMIDVLEKLRLKYLATKDKKYWKELIRWLPESWLQTRTITMNYENLLAICSKSQRRFHKLNEWSGHDDNSLNNFILFARMLPYSQELIFIDEVEVL